MKVKVGDKVKVIDIKTPWRGLIGKVVQVYPDSKLSVLLTNGPMLSYYSKSHFKKIVSKDIFIVELNNQYV